MNKAVWHDWKDTHTTTILDGQKILKCTNCDATTVYTGPSFDPFEGVCPNPKSREKPKMRIVTYYVGETAVWKVESPEVPDSLTVLQTILYLSQNGHGDVTRYEVQL